MVGDVLAHAPEHPSDASDAAVSHDHEVDRLTFGRRDERTLGTPHRHLPDGRHAERHRGRHRGFQLRRLASSSRRFHSMLCPRNTGTTCTSRRSAPVAAASAAAASAVSTEASEPSTAQPIRDGKSDSACRATKTEHRDSRRMWIATRPIPIAPPSTPASGPTHTRSTPFASANSISATLGSPLRTLVSGATSSERAIARASSSVSSASRSTSAPTSTVRPVSMTWTMIRSAPTAAASPAA